MHDGGGVILKYHHLNQMFYVLSKTISIPSTFLVWLNKPGVSRIVISRTPIFHFSRPLSILHAAIKQKSSNHTESPLPFTPTPPTSPPHPKKRSQFIVQLSTSHHFFVHPSRWFASPRHSNGWDVTRSFHGCVPTSLATPRCASASSTPCCWSYHLRAKIVPSGKPVVFFRWNNCEKINSKYSVCCVFVVCWVRMYCTQIDYKIL